MGKSTEDRKLVIRGRQIASEMNLSKGAVQSTLENVFVVVYQKPCDYRCCKYCIFNVSDLHFWDTILIMLRNNTKSHVYGC